MARPGESFIMGQPHSSQILLNNQVYKGFTECKHHQGNPFQPPLWELATMVTLDSF